MLTNQPNYYGRLGMPLDDLIEQIDDSPSRFAALNENRRFAPADFPHTRLDQVQTLAARNPVISLRIFGPLESKNPYSVAECLAVAEWLAENVYLPR
ncbi:MAG TPA: hypothetical protein VGH47_10715, partial [Xanthobacteraceae bacterium]